MRGSFDLLVPRVRVETWIAFYTSQSDDRSPLPQTREKAARERTAFCLRVY